MRWRGVSAVLAAASLAAFASGCSHNKPEVNEAPSGDPGEKNEQAACDQEIALACPDGMSDGCGRKADDGAALTNYHVCLPAEEQASQPCEQEIARVCGEGLTDACLIDPPAASTHVCVQATAGAEPAPGEPSEGQPPPGEPSEGEPSDPNAPTQPEGGEG
jgi:hypothetical protein